MSKPLQPDFILTIRNSCIDIGISMTTDNIRFFKLNIYIYIYIYIYI